MLAVLLLCAAGLADAANRAEPPADDASREQQAGRDGTTGKVVLRARRLTLDAAGTLCAEGVRMTACDCDALAVGAARARLAGDGQRLHLRRPWVALGPVPFLWAPYWAVPVGSGVSGLLAPGIGYSGRDGVRIDQGAYLAAGRVADAMIKAQWIQKRGFGGQARLRYFSASHGDGSVRFVGQRDDGRWRGSALGGIALSGRYGTLTAIPELVSDASVWRDLARSPRLVFAPYSRSRLWGRLHAGPLSIVALGDLYQQLQGAVASAGDPFGRVAARADLEPVALTPGLLLLGHVMVTRVFAQEGVGELATEPAVRPATEVRIAPDVAWSGGVGWLRALLSAGYRMGAIVGHGEASDPLRARQAFVLGGELALPLGRSFGAEVGRLLHELEPILAWRSTFGSQLAEQGTLLDQLFVTRGHVGSIGLRTRLIGYGGDAPPRDRLFAEVRLLGGSEGPWLLSARVEMRPLPLLQLEGELLQGLEGGGDTQLNADACLELRGQRLCAGYLRQRAQTGPVSPWLGDLGGVDPAVLPTAALLATDADHARASVALRLGRLGLGSKLFVDTRRVELTHARFWAKLTALCGCVDLQLAAEVRAGQGVPDLFARLSLPLGV